MITMQSNGYIPYPRRRKVNKVVDGIKVYQCTKCQEYKPKDDYYKLIHNACGIMSKCKECCKEMNKTAYDKQKEKKAI